MEGGGGDELTKGSRGGGKISMEELKRFARRESGKSPRSEKGRVV